MAHQTVSVRLYVSVFLSLMVLTAITVWIAFYDLGRINTIVAITIASGKATLVVLYFMHLRYSSRLTWVFVGAGFFWMGILFTLTMSDYLSRGWLPIPGK